MSSDMFEFEECFFNDPFSPLSDSSSIDILKAFQENPYNFNSSSSTFTNEILDTPINEIDQIAPAAKITTLLSSSPPSHQLESLSLYQMGNSVIDTPFNEIDQIAPTAKTTTLLSSSPPSHQLESLSLYQMGNSVNSQDFCPLEVKTEQNQLPLYDYIVKSNSFLPHSYGGGDNIMKMMQRSYSSISFDRRSNGFIFQPKIDSLIESSNLHSQGLTSPDHGFASSHMRRVCSTGDLQSSKSNKTGERLSSSPLAMEGSFMEESNFKVGRYSPEERKERILRYKAKRTQRNFNKTIKYACRKTLADNRLRIRGRFARNDESDEIPKASTFHRYEDEDEFWMDRWQEEDEEGSSRRQFFNTYMPTTQCHQFGYYAK
ncbi:hypothetical protein L1887_27037 [Cichorium endivia]|nr:hypothetical protein L1887_27037 [Cichorium endivia]